MNHIILLASGLAAVASVASAAPRVSPTNVDSLYQLHATDIHGSDFDLGTYNNTVTLVVNVATYCGTTKENYEMMASLQKKYEAHPDFTMLLFPCNQFLDQEPHANSVIETFAETYLNLTDHTVKMFAKSNVNGPCKSESDGACDPDSTECCPANNDIYSFLQSVVPGKCSWNFNKYIVGRDGKPTGARFGDSDLEDKLTPVIDQLLASKA